MKPSQFPSGLRPEDWIGSFLRGVLGTLILPLHTLRYSCWATVWHGRDNKDTDNARHPLCFQFPVPCSITAHILPPGCTARRPRRQQVSRPQQQRAPGAAWPLSPGSLPVPQPLLGDAAELSTARGLHGFTSLQKQIKSPTFLFEQVSQLHCKLWYDVCHAAQRCCTQRQEHRI